MRAPLASPGGRLVNVALVQACVGRPARALVGRPACGTLRATCNTQRNTPVRYATGL